MTIERWLVMILHLLIVLGVGYVVYGIKYQIDRSNFVVDQCGVYATMRCIEQAEQEFEKGR